jgi:hypothetical protein
MGKYTDKKGVLGLKNSEKQVISPLHEPVGSECRREVKMMDAPLVDQQIKVASALILGRTSQGGFICHPHTFAEVRGKVVARINLGTYRVDNRPVLQVFCAGLKFRR